MIPSVRCAACGAENPAVAVACLRCGEPLAADDGAPLPPIPDGGLAATMPDWLREPPAPMPMPVPAPLHAAAPLFLPDAAPLAPPAPEGDQPDAPDGPWEVALDSGVAAGLATALIVFFALVVAALVWRGMTGR